MKISLEKFGIYLTPENYADKMYIAKFIKAENNEFGNIEATHTSENINGTCGYLDPKRIVEDEFEDDNSVTINEIDGLNIFPHKI